MKEKTKERKSHKPVYPDYVSLENLDAILKSGMSPIELMADMKRLIMQRAMEAELDEHLQRDKHEKSKDGNYRNGYGSKTLRMDHGPIELATPRDREGTFEPQLVPKRQKSFLGFDDKIISMYGLGMSTRAIQEHLKEMYATDVSPEFISNVTAAVQEEVKAWKNRSLEEIYPIVYLDAMVVKVNEDKRIVNKSLYLALGVNMQGHKEILGLWMANNEGAKFWLGILTELKNRGVQDIFIACCDGLTGFPEAINAVYPQTKVQLCIVHMLRNSLKFVSYKDRKEVAKDLRSIYSAVNADEAYEQLLSFAQKWDDKYAMISQSWQDNWQEVIPFLEYPESIRKAIYTTNAIEATNGQIRRVIKTKGSFPNDEAVYKIVYLALQRAQKKWTMPIQNWGQALSQFFILFGSRCKM
jgi:putative transposase